MHIWGSGPLLVRQIRLDFIRSYSSSRVSPTRARVAAALSSLPCRSFLVCVERVIKLLRLGHASDSCRDPILLTVVRRSRGWKKLSRVWTSSTVSWSLYLCYCYDRCWWVIYWEDCLIWTATAWYYFSFKYCSPGSSWWSLIEVLINTSFDVRLSIVYFLKFSILASWCKFQQVDIYTLELFI
jgi:hypothetical protein